MVPKAFLMTIVFTLGLNVAEANPVCINALVREFVWGKSKNNGEKIKNILDTSNKKVLNQLDTLGWTLLIYASAKNKISLVYELVKKPKVDVNISDDIGMTALMWAILTKNPQVVKMLLTREDLRINEADGTGKTALIWAIISKVPKIIEAVLKRDDLNLIATDNSGQTAWDWAYSLGLADEFQDILEKLYQPKKPNVPN